jgi:hypothetical protein
LPFWAIVAFLWPYLGIYGVEGRHTLMLACSLVGGPFVGSFMALYPRAIILRPAFFCLPGRRRALRQVVFAIGFVVSAVTSWWVLVLHDELWIASGQSMLVFPAMLGILLPAFVCGAVLLVSRPARWVAGILLLGYVSLALALPQVSGLSWAAATEDAIARHPAIVLAFGAGSAGVLWLYMGRMRLTPWLRVAIERGGTRWRAESGVGRLLLRRICLRGHFDRWKYVWGTLYTSPLVDVRLRALAAVLGALAVVLLAYAGPFVRLTLYTIVCLSPVPDWRDLPFSSRPFPTAGRYERYFAAMAAYGLSWGAALLLGAGMILGAALLACLAPDIVIEGVARSAEPADPRCLWIPLFLIPVVGLVQRLLLWQRGTPSILVAASMYVGRLLLVVAVIAMLLPLFAPSVFAALRTWQVFVVGALAWVFLAFAVRRVALRGDLVDQRRQKRV